MRINVFVAQATGLSRRAADQVITTGQVKINGQPAKPGDNVNNADEVKFNGKVLTLPTSHQTILLNKPAGYVTSRQGQGSQTIYDLLPAELHDLKPVGRLDKDSSGLLLLTDDGQLAQQLTHPSYLKQKIYKVELNKQLDSADRQKVEQGVILDDGLSKLQLDGADAKWTITMSEGRNRQIRRTFKALGYEVKRLHRIEFGSYKLDGLSAGNYRSI